MVLGDGYVQIGSLLRGAREERGLTLHQASRLLHIRLRYLQALEEGRVTDMPGVAYAKGYLQAYAAFLQLDREEILRRFEQMEGMIARRGFFLPQVFSKDKHPSHGAVTGSLIAALFVYITWIFWIKPPPEDLSIIDTPPGYTKPRSISAMDFERVACLRPQEALYPPCHFTLKTRSIMEFGQR